MTFSWHHGRNHGAAASRLAMRWLSVMALASATLMDAAAADIRPPEKSSGGGGVAASSSHLEFLPEIERVLDSRDGLGARAYLSFSNGTVTVEQGAENAQRNRQLHEDLKYDGTPEREEWTGVDLEAAPASEEMWNATPEQLIAALADNLAPPLASMQVTHGVWYFRTRDGVYGLMRVEGFAPGRGNARAMKVVYKLARAVRPAKTVSLSLPLSERIRQFVAGEPSTTGFGLEIFQQNPAGGMELRKDLVSTEIHQESDPRGILISGHVYYLKSANRFYIQWEGGLGASTFHYYGPFEGDPVKVLGLPAATN